MAVQFERHEDGLGKSVVSYNVVRPRPFLK